ncbi:hypothetical protein ACSYDW_17665 [Paeniglutamicibacter sp. R2-26]|uniref:hypothetical protein n=1 Tax=Paeniglutamicibacter sp. R2-26 TaxID=3144417 RepID=UPI003EE5433E
MMSAQVLEIPPSTFSQRAFFVPGMANEGDALERWHEISSAMARLAHTDRKVQRLEFTNHGDRLVAEVGYELSDGMSKWLVLAIFEPPESSPDSPWKICMVRIRNGKVITRDPSWPVPRTAVLQAKDFGMPAKKDEIQNEDPALETAEATESTGGDEN